MFQLIECGKVCVGEHYALSKIKVDKIFITKCPNTPATLSALNTHICLLLTKAHMLDFCSLALLHRNRYYM